MVNQGYKAIEDMPRDGLALLVANLRGAIITLLSNLPKNSPMDEAQVNLYAYLQGVTEELDKAFGSFNHNHAARIRAARSLAAVRPAHTEASHQITYCSPAMHQIIQITEQASRSDAPVLITGETGVGKELVAYYLHLRSLRKQFPIIPVNCAAITKELFESHLFGHKQGAFTGAIREQAGIIRAANGGTLFLDEIGELPLELQPKLLRFLQSGEIHTVGQSHPTYVSVRVVASTNRDLEPEIHAGRFRADLYYRLNIIPIKVPPLRYRREEVPLLINFFLDKYLHAKGNGHIQFSQEALDHLIAYDWPGNVRELSNLVLRMIALAENKTIVSAADLPHEFTKLQRDHHAELRHAPSPNRDANNPSEQTLAEIIATLERQKIREALVKHNWNFARAARQLGLSTFGLRKKYRRLFSLPADLATGIPERQPE